MQPKIKRVSLLFKLLFQAVFIVLPLAHIISWISAPTPIFLLGQGSGFILRIIPESTPILHTLSLHTKLWGFLVSGIPVVVMECMVYFLIKLFGLYQRGEIFTLQNVKYLKKIGYALLIVQLARPICEGFLTMIVTWHNPPGHRIASVTMQGLDLTLILTAFLIILISWIMAEGCRLREEQQLTI